MKFEIMVGILFDLLSKKCVTAKYLSEKYEVSIRSIYRYINSLEMAGVPLYSVKGNNGGFKIIEQYKLSSTFMTVKEFEQVINALTAINEGVPNKILESALTKLKASIKNEYAGFDIKSGNLIIDAGPWGDTVGYKSKLILIQKSIEEQVKIDFEYHDRNGEITNRIIEPHLILFKQGIWYVYAYCSLRESFRFFKIGRINNLNLLNEKFTRKEINKSELPIDYWHQNILAETIEFEVDKSILSDIQEWIGVNNVSIKKEKYLANAKLPFDEGLISKLMSYGNKIKIISPAKLRERILEVSNQRLKNYK